jgi:hypothetical protein
MLQKFSFENFLQQIEKANVLIDVDARTGHNHGTKIRMRRNSLPYMYEKATVIIDIAETNPIVQESYKRLATLGGTEKQLKNIPKRRC